MQQEHVDLQGFQKLEPDGFLAKPAAKIQREYLGDVRIGEPLPFVGNHADGVIGLTLPGQRVQKRSVGDDSPVIQVPAEGKLAAGKISPVIIFLKIAGLFFPDRFGERIGGGTLEDGRRRAIFRPGVDVVI